ncbi:MAG: PKD domain-containing protein, partial [Chitinophagaceae bacterium]
PNSGTLGLRVTPDAIKSTTEGSDFYFFVLERNARSQLYGSFFGQDDNIARYPDHVDGGTSRFDKNGVIYQSVCANCEGPNGLFFTSPGVVAPLNGALSASAGGCNLAAIKIAFNLAGVGASVQSSVNGIPRTSTGCLPLTVDFRDTIAMGRRYVWDFGDGSPQVVTTDAVNRHTYNQLGSFRVMLVSIDSSACNIADTSYITIRVRDDAAQINMQIQKVGGCESTTFQFTNTSQSSPGKPFNSNSFILQFGDGTTRRIGAETVTHTYAGFGTYDVKLVLVDTNYCNSPDSITRQLRIAPNVRAQISSSPTGCAPYLANIRNTSVGGTEFIWNFGNGVTFNGVNPPPQLYATPGTYTIQLTANDPASCNLTDATSVTITVSGKPVAAFNFNPNPPTENTPINFNNLSVGGVRFKWDFGDGDSLITLRRDTIVQHSFNATQVYNVCLTAYNAAGCDSTVCLPVAAKVVPILDIANAFAPSGNNRTIKVQSFGIRQMNWRIY